ncbi:MAG: STAS domain-containing protein [Spirochaetota bacterium]
MVLAKLAEDFTARHPETSATVDRSEGGILLSLAGSLDMRVSRDLDDLLASVVDLAEPGHPFTVDLGSVDYMSSTGVGTLVLALSRARKKNIVLTLRNMTDKVCGVFELLGFLQFFRNEVADE